LQRLGKQDVEPQVVFVGKLQGVYRLS
jgi:hypothetical protein